MAIVHEIIFTPDQVNIYEWTRAGDQFQNYHSEITTPKSLP